MISPLLEGKTALERADIKATEIAKIQPSIYQKADYSIEIVDIEKVDQGVHVFVKATKGGKPVGFGDGSVETESITIQNPPILVPDGTTHTVTIKRGGKEVQAEEPNYVENVEEALRLVIAQTID